MCPDAANQTHWQINHPRQMERVKKQVERLRQLAGSTFQNNELQKSHSGELAHLPCSIVHSRIHHISRGPPANRSRTWNNSPMTLLLGTMSSKSRRRHVSNVNSRMYYIRRNSEFSTTVSLKVAVPSRLLPYDNVIRITPRGEAARNHPRRGREPRTRAVRFHGPND